MTIFSQLQLTILIEENSRDEGRPDGGPEPLLEFLGSHEKVRFYANIRYHFMLMLLTDMKNIFVRIFLLNTLLLATEFVVSD